MNRALLGPALWGLVALAAWLGLASGAGAVVGGQEDRSPLSRTSVMVLNSRGVVCSGIVLGPTAILTAGHCVAGGSQLRIHFRLADGSPALIEPAAVAIHPGYDSGAVAGRRRSIDLALVRVTEPLPAAFSAASLSGEAARLGQEVTLAGYGMAREGDGRSSGVFRSATLAVSEPYGPSSILIWASPGQGAAGGACEGDSGGPIALSSGGVFAVTTWARGRGKSRCGEMSQGALVGPQRGWIDRTLAAWGLGPAGWR